jgi:hypothetical protein
VWAPRFRIAWLMVAVAIVAINFAAIRAALGLPAGPPVALLLVGALPMANVLLVGILVARQSPRRRPFLLGFEVFGAVAMALYIHSVTSSPPEVDGPIVSYLLLVLGPLNSVIVGNRPFVRGAIGVSVGVLMLVGPQLAFALIGGLLSRRFNITITRR